MIRQGVGNNSKVDANKPLRTEVNLSPVAMNFVGFVENHGRTP